MLRFHNYDVVFQEIPNEVTLAINISNCPHRCKGCHSPHLWEDTGELLTESVLLGLFEKYGSAITCICFMGGDRYPHKVAELALFSRRANVKTAWYSGLDTLPEIGYTQYFDYIKLGAYIGNLGGLDSASTNQRLYRIENGEMIDMTDSFQRGKSDRGVNIVDEK